MITISISETIQSFYSSSNTSTVFITISYYNIVDALSLWGQALPEQASVIYYKSLIKLIIVLSICFP